MDSSKPDEVMPNIISAIEALESPHLRSELLKLLITPPLRERRIFVATKSFWPHSGIVEGDIWLFAFIAGQPIAFAFSNEGYALLGRRWGLVWVDNLHYGDPDVWYESLIDLVVDSGYFTDYLESPERMK